MEIKNVSVDMSGKRLMITGLSKEYMEMVVDDIVCYFVLDGNLVVDDEEDQIFEAMYRLSRICSYRVLKGKGERKMEIKKVHVEMSGKRLTITGLSKEQIEMIVDDNVWYYVEDGDLVVDDEVDKLFEVMYKLSCICDYKVI